MKIKYSKNSKLKLPIRKFSQLAVGICRDIKIIFRFSLFLGVPYRAVNNNLNNKINTKVIFSPNSPRDFTRNYEKTTKIGQGVLFIVILKDLPNFYFIDLGNFCRIQILLFTFSIFLIFPLIWGARGFWLIQPNLY